MIFSVASLNCLPHVLDYGCVTLLLADSTSGALQIKTRDGNWIDADPMPGAFVVNIGDMMERWTNGEWRSTPHRVINSSSHYRVSVPFFFEPNFSSKIRPLRTCVDRTGGAELFEETKYGDHLLSKIKGNFYS
jgi:isopenicillin N synthase-like dioxygenase